MPTIETERLTKFYGSHRGVEEVTLSVQQGEIFGFLGPNGAGKTTTIRTLLDLLHPTSGSARIFGLDSRRDSVAIRRRLGNLPGDFGYGKLATGREAVSLLARLRGVSGLGAAAALAERFQADLDRPMGHLSRGNRQKIGLILAALSPARAAHLRRAHERARSAHAGGVPGAGARGTRARLRGVPLLARARRGPAGVRPRGDHPRGQGGRGGARVRAAGEDAAPGLGAVRRAGRHRIAARAARA